MPVPVHYVNQHLAFPPVWEVLAAKVEGEMCIIGEQEQWRPWFRRSKLYSLMAATLRPGLAINNFYPLDQSSLRLISTTFFFLSLISIGMAVELSV